MEYQKIINILDNKTNKTPKYRTKTQVKINDKTKTGSYDVPDQTKFKTAKIKSSLCDYIDA